MRVPTRHFLPALLTTFAAVAPQAQDLQGERHFSLQRDWSMRLPRGWRQLTPDEAHALKKAGKMADMPPDMQVLSRPPAQYPYGAVDRWLEEGYDGRSMMVLRLDGEPAEGEEGVAAYSQPWSGDGWRMQVIAARWGEVGPDGHPAILREARFLPDHGTEADAIHALDVIAPSGGDTIVLSFRWREGDAEARRLYDAMLDTVTFARPARGQGKVADRVLYPAVVGALVLVLLLVLRRRAHRRPPRDGLPAA